MIISNEMHGPWASSLSSLPTTESHGTGTSVAIWDKTAALQSQVLQGAVTAIQLNHPVTTPHQNGRTCTWHALQHSRPIELNCSGYNVCFK